MKIEPCLDYQTILANRACPVHFALRFVTEEIPQPRPRPAAFCVVLDRSGSMDGEPLRRAKEAAQLVVRNLRAADQFSLIAFDDIAQTVIPLQTCPDRADWINRIGSIQTNGSTNLTGGWMLGRDELKKAAADCSRRLLLLSDGQLNVGIVEPGQVFRVVGAGLEQDQVRTSCLGFGPNYNEDLMAECARVTGGQFYDAQSPEKLPAIFAAELEGLQKIVIQNLRIRFKRLDFCDTAALLGEYPKVTLPDGRVEVSVGDLTGGETRIVCFELGVLALPMVSGQPVCSLEGEQLLELEFLFDEIGATDITSQTVHQVIRIKATQNPAEVTMRKEVISWVALQKAGRTMEQVNRQMDAGQRLEAEALLARAIAQLEQYGQPELVGEALAQLRQLSQIIQGSQFSIRERKLSKYRSSSYLRMSSADAWTADCPPPSFKQSPGAASGPEATPTPPKP